MGVSKELFMALRQGLMDGISIEEQRRIDSKKSSTIIKVRKKLKPKKN